MNNSLSICTIGGGTGMPIINKALIKAGFKNIRSIVTTFDSGGDSGRMRTDERGNLLAFSDYWRSLMSLWKDGNQKEVWEEILKFRDGRGRNFGNLLFQFMAEKTGNLSYVDSLFSKLTGAELMGEVIPVSTEPANVCFKTASGKQYCGEHHLDELRMSLDMVTEMWLEPNVKAKKEAMNAMKKADVIIVCPGSMYGSVLINFLPDGMIGAYNQSRAKKILMTNIMSVASENDGFTQDDYVEIFKKYLKTSKPFELVLMADLSNLDENNLEKVKYFYSLEHSKPIRANGKSPLYETRLADIVIIEKKNMRLRHSEEKLAEIFDKLEI